MSTVLKVENLSKQYRLGTVGSGTLRDDMTRFWARMRGKEDPTLKIGEVNDRTTKGNSDYVWALKDINFEVEQGEILGIIGKNGAGKSTLLKILSKVTAPTTGRVRAKGRIASLLEVGTGFHPELTGRENIYLNGAILGMTKAEIRAKLDEIVDFAGVEKYLDTPVKRYSSGMTVRLGFAVAAHLEPEILIVDEVLAVGDAEFQKKAIGKMQDVSKGEGRTVLFVSHNMSSIQTLCNKCILLENGGLTYSETTRLVIEKYLKKNSSNSSFEREFDDKKDAFITFGSIIEKTESIELQLTVFSSIKRFISIDFKISDAYGVAVGFASLGTFEPTSEVLIEKGENVFNIQMPIKNLGVGNYMLSIDLTIPDVAYLDKVENALSFEVIRPPKNGIRRVLNQSWGYGSVELPISLIQNQYDAISE